MIETISITLDSEDKRIFEEFTGINIIDCVKILINSVKYGGKVEFDQFWSDEHMEKLKESIRSFDEGHVVKFTAEEWEKFVNEQELQ